MADVVELGCIVCLNKGFSNPAETYGTEEELLKQVEELLKEQEKYGYLDDLPF